MVENVEPDFASLSEVLKYDPSTGDFTWLKNTSSRARAGSRAGVWQRMQNGKDYLAITFRGRKMSAAQVAWCLQTGKWPDRSVFYADDDTTNLRFSNLRLAEHKANRVTGSDGKVRYKMSIEQIRHYGLRRYYGISVTQFAEMFAAQGGVCAICNKAESAKIPGRVPKEPRNRVRDLSVDHDHETGAVRGLLCNSCNHMLGECNDDVSILRSAISYLEYHATLKKDVHMSTKSKGPPE